MAEPEFNWDDYLEFAAHSDIGMRRSNNQDAYTVVLANDLQAWRQRGHLFMVADGMGAHAAGELASKLAVDGVPHNYHKYAGPSAPEALQKSFIETNSAIHRRGQDNSDFRHMGTTGSVLVLLPQGALVAHIGDSRIYRLHQGQLQQLTRDHSLIWELRELGQISEHGDVAQAVPKNVITRSLGPNANVDPDIEGPVPIEVGDVFLLCSDGLTGKIEDAELASMMASLPPEEAVHLLVNLANLRGGPDNITVVIIKVRGQAEAGGDPAAEPITVGAAKSRVAGRPLIWVGAAVCLLAAPVLWLTHNPLPTALALASSVLLALTGALYHYLVKARGVPLGAGRRLGRGPYTRTDCPSDEHSVSMLAAINRELRKTVQQQEFELDLAEYDSRCEAAGEAEAARDLPAAVLLRARAIRLLMEAVREELNRKASDSAIGL